ncbi:putative pth11-like integral membrane protein [Neofusicoccum parvum]|nr:putative pth11-like integral membrane protein [Neofusicoccum parvum]
MLGSQLKWLWASMIVYVLGTGLAKLSILCQYLRVFIGKKTTLATWIAIIFVSAYTVQATFVGIFSCVPVEKYWNRPTPGHCIDGPIYYYFAAAMNMITDIFVFIIPIPALLRLNISNHNKYGMIIAFSFGSIGCIVSAIRLYLISHVSTSPDLSKTSPGPAMWTAVELHLCVMCACLPSLRPLLSRVFVFVAGGRRPSTGGTAATTPHKRTPFASTWSRGGRADGHGRLGSASAASEGRTRTGSEAAASAKEGDAGPRRSDVEKRADEDEMVELSELDGIKVTSTSEVYSIRAESGGRSSAESESRLTRGGQGQDPWGYTCEVKCQGPS